MLKKHFVLLGIIISTALIFIATRVYPGGSMFDKYSVGFDWSKNFFSNLFLLKALNGADNPSRVWADAGMIFHSLSFALFFNQFSKKIPTKSASKIIKYIGASCMLFSFLIVTPLHDKMIIISSTMYLISIFYITVFVLKSSLHLFKFFCVTCLLIFYFTLYLYGTGSFVLLAIMQKVTVISSILLILGLHYFTRKEDFAHIKSTKQKALKGTNR